MRKTAMIITIETLCRQQRRHTHARRVSRVTESAHKLRVMCKRAHLSVCIVKARRVRAFHRPGRARVRRVCALLSRMREIWVRILAVHMAVHTMRARLNMLHMHADFARCTSTMRYVYVYFYAVLLHDTNIFVPLIKISACHAPDTLPS